MKLSQILLAVGIAPFAVVNGAPAQEASTTRPHMGAAHDSTIDNIIERRGLIDDMKMKEKCKSSFKGEKSKHKAACASESEGDVKNLCLLRGVLADASEECRAAIVKSMEF